MVFLNPSILLGLLTASIPILIHILNLRKLKKVEFSSLSFLKELQKSKIRKVKIKQWLLLLLRTLIIIFLVLAFAKPTLENVSLVGVSSSAKSSLAFIIDNSFSMNYVNTDGSNFNRSKKIAKNIVAKMEDGDEFNFIITNDSVITTLNKETAINIIDNLEISFATEIITRKLKNAVRILEYSQTINKEIFLFSDLQESTFSDTNTFNFTDNNIRCYIFNLSSDKPNNYSVSNLILENSIIELNKSLTFSSIINNHSDEPINNLATSLFLNNKRIAQQSVNIKPGGSSYIKFLTTLNTTGLIEARVELEVDKLTEDNTNYLNFFVPKKIKLLLLYDNLNDIKFIETALSISDQFEFIAKHSNENFNNKLNEFDVVFLLSAHLNNSSQFNEYIKSGGNIVFMPPSYLSVNILSDLEKSIKLPKSETVIKTGTDELSYAEFGTIDFEHPIFFNLFNDREKKQIESPKIFRYIKFQQNSFINSIIKLNDGSIFLGEYKLGNGKVLFFNSSVDLTWNNFPLKGIFAPIISKIVYYLSSSNEQTQSFIVGEKIPLDVSRITFPLIEVSLPNGEDKISIDPKDNNLITYNNTDIMGSYKFYNKNNLIKFAYVNLDGKESDLSIISNVSLNEKLELMFSSNYIIFSQEDNYFEKINQARFGTELWKLFLILAFILAIVEMYIARSTKNDLMNLK